MPADRELQGDESSDAPEGRLPYRPPELVRFGTIGDLTRGGEGTMPDGAGGGFDFTGAEP